ncbi:MAG: hypothetical protein V4508_26605 [Pseudomonadota bacterium]
MKLKVSFDVDQTSGELDWEFSPGSRPYSGRHAGSILLQPGELLHLQVDGNGGPHSGFEAFRIVECCLMTRPQPTQIGPKLPTLFSAPSPFVGDGAASYAFPLEFDCSPLRTMPDGSLRMTQHWSGALQVDQPPGRWDLSFLITVAIARDADEPLLRVYSFDPESEVGDGTHTSEPAQR